MSITDSLPLSNMQDERSLPSADESSNDTAYVIPKVISIKNFRYHQKPMRHGCLYTKKYTSALRTKRYLKYLRLANKRAMKHEIKQKLEKQIRELEFKQN